MKRFVLAIILIYGCSGQSYTQKKPALTVKKKQDIPKQVSETVTKPSEPESRTITKSSESDKGPIKKPIYVHYSAKYCTECHEQTPRNGVKYLKYGGDYKQLCHRCHSGTNARDLHPVGIEPTEEIMARKPKNFPLLNGKIDCITCHDIVAQCRDIPVDNIYTKRQMFLREAPYRRLTNLCFKCHNESKFKRYNSHKQLNENGDIVVRKCLYCHSEKPDEKTSSYKEVKLIGNLEMLCVRCHYAASKRSLHTKHLRRPSAKVLESIKKMEAELSIILPLNDDGKVTCVTCHNPHQKGVISTERAGAKGADEIHRHRLPDNMCLKCHQM